MLIALLLAAASLDAWKPLAGEWIGEGHGGKGGFTFAFEAQGKVLVRHNFAEYPNAPRHDDLMVLWAAEDGVLAKYWDNEGHVIDYKCAASEKAWTCEGGMFKLAYELTAPDALKISFFVRGKPYIEAVAKRKK